MRRYIFHSASVMYAEITNIFKYLTKTKIMVEITKFHRAGSLPKIHLNYLFTR